MKNLAKIMCVAFAGICLIASLSAKAESGGYTHFGKSDLTILRKYYKDTNFPATTNESSSYYEPGTTLPENVTYTELPLNITKQLTVPLPEEEYVAIDRNYYLIDHDKRFVIDAERNE